MSTTPTIHQIINFRDKAAWMNAVSWKVENNELKPAYKGKQEPVNYNVARLVWNWIMKPGACKQYYCPECSRERREEVYHYTTSERDAYAHSLTKSQRSQVQMFYELVKY